MSGPMSSKVSKLRLSLAWPPVRWKARAGRRNRTSGEFWLKTRRANGRVPGPSAPFCAGRRDMGAHDRRIDHLNQVRGAARLGQERQHRLENTPLAQSPEPLPDAVPLAELSRQGAPSDIVN